MKNARLFLLFFTFAICFFISDAICAQRSCPLNVSGSESTRFGLYIKDLKSGEIVDSCNSDVDFIPASVTKALTCATVTSQLPADTKFLTEFFVTGMITNGTVAGNLEVMANGDPTIESCFFKTFRGVADSVATRLASRGISMIKGRIKFLYPPQLNENVPSGWLSEDLIHPYGAAHKAVNYSDNRLIVDFKNGATTPSARRLQIKKEKGARLCMISGTETVLCPLNKKDMGTIACPNPEDIFETSLLNALEQHGINVCEEDLMCSESRSPVYTHLSPAYSEIMRSLMFRSDNLMAEGMLRTLSPQHWRRFSTEREMSIWKARGLDTKGVFIEDGSGLSRKNRLTPRFLSEVIEWMVQSVDASLYTSFFPLVGREGTVRNWMVGSALDGRMRAKTGSMNGVQSFAGLIVDDNGEPTHVVVVMVNKFSCNRSALKTAIGNYIIDKLCLTKETDGIG